MKNKLLKTFTSLVLVALMVISVVPAFAITIGAADSSVTIGFSGGTGKNMDSIPFSDETTGVSVVFEKNTHTTSPRWDSDCVRFYGTTSMTNSMTVSVPDGCTIKSISFTMSGTYNLNKVTADSGNISGTEWTADVANSTGSVVFTTTAQTRFVSVNVTYTTSSEEGGSEESSSGTTETPVECQHTNTTKVPEVPATCTAPGTEAGVKCVDCEYIISGCGPIEATGHTYENGVCTECDAKIPTYVKVTTDPTDWSGEYLIVYEDGNVAFNGSLTTLDAVSNTVEVTILDNKIAGDYSKNTFTIEKSGDNYIIKSASGYYIGNTSNSNVLSSSNSTAYTNSISLDGNVNIISSGGAYLRYNATSGQTRFRYYKSSSYTSQKAITLYKLADSESTTPETEPTIKSFGVSLNKGVTINVTYDIPDTWLTANAGAKVVFSNGTEVVITEAGENVYSVTLTPAKINNDLTVKLVKEDGTVVIEEKDVSFAKYKELIGTGDEKLTALLNSIKTYADAADGTLQGELENTVESVEGSVTSTGALFNAYGAALKEQASIKLSVDTAKIAGDYRLTVTLGSKTVVENELLADYITAGNLIVINGLFPSNFDETINVTVSDGTTDVATLSFTFNTYLKDVYGTANSELKNLIVAAYNYGVAAEAYAGN